MNEQDRKLVLAIAKQNGEAIAWIKKYEEIHGKLGEQKVLPPAVIEPVQPLVNRTPKKALKFFGKNEPVCNSSVVLKDIATTSPEKIEEIERGQIMLRKAIVEFCLEFKIRQFDVNYLDNT